MFFEALAGIVVVLAALLGIFWIVVKFEEQTRKQFNGCTFGVAFIQPNGSSSDFEAELTNQILLHGGACVAVNKNAIRDVLRGEMVLTLPEDQLLVAGTVISKVGQSRIEPTLTVDFRCFDAKGQIFGAGFLEEIYSANSYARNNRSFVIQQIAQRLVERIYVSHGEDKIEVGIDNGRRITLPVRAKKV